MPPKNMKIEDIVIGKMDSLTNDDPATYEMKIENPTINYIQPNRYGMINDIVRWAIKQDKDVLFSEYDNTFTVSISSPQKSEDE